MGANYEKVYYCISDFCCVVNSSLIIRYSTEIFSTAVSGLTPGRGIMPDYPVTPTIQDYIDEKDVVKDFALELIGKDKS